MAEEEAAAAPAPAPEYKLRIVGQEGAPGSVEDVDGTADVVLSCDGKKFVVKREAAGKIPLVAACLEKHDPDSGAAKEEEHLGQVTVIPLPVVKAEVATAIVEFCEQHEADKDHQDRMRKKPLLGRVEDNCPSWAQKYITDHLIIGGDEKQHDKLFEVMMGAHALGVADLEALCGLAAASIIKGKAPTAMRELFGIEGDFQPEEEEKILEDTKWSTQWS
eukprot:TRINITY_DN1724_c0_g1_i4.p3 TRINITY_DN1724_c0_g1~~TRINITY_DN1724_c0_g1_i4.p3  ORF type:complete len:219 (+),score=105.32 TRINITY_DN1724_c0_g1_i4:89-745(+)